MTDRLVITPKKKKGSRAKVGATSARTADLKSKAYDMLLAGNRCPAIGAALGVSRVHAWKLARDGLAELQAETLDKMDEWRTVLTQEHLEQLALGKKLRDGQAPSIAHVKGIPADAAGFGVVDKALSQLKALWVPSLPSVVKTELTGANGGPLQTHAIGTPDLSKLTDEQLAALEAILSSVVPEPDAALKAL